MSVSLSTIPAMKGINKGFHHQHHHHHASLLKGSPGRGGGSGFYPSPLPPGPHYIDIFTATGTHHTHSLLHHHHHHNPLKSLGRLVSDTQASAMPLNFAGGAPPFLGHHHGHHHHHASVQHVLQHSIPYLNHMLPGAHGVYPKHHEDLHAGGPLSSSDFSGSPSSDRSSSASTSPPKQQQQQQQRDGCSPPSSFRLRGSAADPAAALMKKTRTYSFSEDDLFTVLYGYSRSQQQNVGHAISGVALVPEKSSVSDSRTLPMDTESLELPEGLTVLQTSCGNVSHYGVFTDKSGIPKGTRFGPFQGKLVNTSEIKTYDDNTLMWEVFENGRLSHFVDGRGASGNWMSLVKCARFPEEQNLIAVQVQGQIFYEACKEVAPGQELLVWYGDCYVQFLGIPLTLKVSTEDNETQQPPEDSEEGFKCDRCGKVFAYRYYRDKHLKYTRCVDQGDRKFPCHLCSRSFEKRDRLRIHILHVHEKHRPHKCSVCGKSFSQSSSLNKHMRVHSGERPYKCVYCNKAFTASSILRTHIRQHSGERPFKCKHCGKAFASHAAHDSHVRRTHAKDNKAFPCDVCGEAFQDVQELKNHMKKHTDKSHLESTIIPSPTNGSLDEVYPVKDNSITQRHAGLNLPYTGLTVLNPEYRPWN